MADTIFDAECPTREVLENISKKWAAVALCLLSERPHRFSELLHGMGGVSQKVLTQTLRNLERHGLITRTVNATTVPISVIYALTGLGESLAEPIGAMRRWTEQHIDEVVRAQKVYDTRE
ncbi:MAG TPA: helix-turn-helix domain-containing protein [Candidatus Limnocylindria bacterium]|nr:helix-turn-helix domain-containing protein [Candidatus Limnocylindria bacterium]